MIRNARPDEFLKIANLWLEASLTAHAFVSDSYWRKMKDSVIRDYLPCSETFVFVDKRQIKGFISLVDKFHIGALFVAPKFQNKRIGRKLLQFVKKRRERLCLNVFVRNEKALRFYQKNDFKIIREQCEPSTAETELVMAWAMGCKSGFSKKYPGAS